MESETRAYPDEVLNVDEERALSLLREVVAEIRAHGQPADLPRLEAAITGRGGWSAEGESSLDVRTFRLQGALFSVRAAIEPPGAVEVSFMSRSP